MRAKVFWNRAEYHTLNAVIIVIGLLGLATAIVSAPLAGFALACKWVVKAAITRARHLNVVNYMVQLERPTRVKR